MDIKRIQKLADFFYSSNSSDDVPMRINVTSGICGCDLSKEEFIQLITIMSYSINLKEDLKIFVSGIIQ